jgi:triosephosphate isomerase
MAARQPFVAGNWKLHGSRAANARLLDGLLAALGGSWSGPAEIAVCPPFVYLTEVTARLAGTGIAVGAQDVATEASGAFTGEVSAPMLRDCGCEYVIIGHSERRALYGDTDAVTARKVGAALAAGLKPILCVGETLAEREADQTLAVVTRQLAAVMAEHGAEPFREGLVAYEPVWAIGTGRTATPEQAQAVHAQIRALVARHDATIASALRILYGGSVKASNARDLFAMPDIDGGLIGGASLDAADFAAICRAACP